MYCVVSKEKRNKCRYCRFMRCRDAGMKCTLALSSDHSNAEIAGLSPPDSNLKKKTSLGMNDMGKYRRKHEFIRSIIDDMQNKFNPKFLFDSEVILIFTF